MKLFPVSSVAADCKDGYGLKLKKNGPTFSSFNGMAAKITTKLLREQSLLFYRFNEGSARARERRAAKPRDARKEGAPIF